MSAVFSHRNRGDLERLVESLSALDRRQRATLWVAVIRAGVWKPLWPIRASLWLNCTLRGPVAGMSGAIHALARLPAAVFDSEWDKFAAFILDGRNADDPTSVGGLNHRDLLSLLKFAELAGWRPPA